MPHTSPQGASAQRRRRLPLNRLLLVGLVALVGVSTTACDRGQAWVARVDGHAIAPANFAKGIPLYAKLSGTTATPTSTPAATAAPDYVLDNSEAGKYALLLIEAKAIRLLNDKHGTKVTDADRTKTRADLLAQDQNGTLKKMPKWFLDQIVSLQADYAALVTYSGKGVDTEARAKQYYAANKGQFDQFCIDVIGTSTQADALAALKRIDNGDDFATVAKDVAKASGSPAAGDKQDGSVGCVPVANIARAVPDKGQFDEVANAADRTGRRPALPDRWRLPDHEEGLREDPDLRGGAVHDPQQPGYAWQRRSVQGPERLPRQGRHRAESPVREVDEGQGIRSAHRSRASGRLEVAGGKCTAVGVDELTDRR